MWPLAADEAGIWLLSGGDAWRYGPVWGDGDVHDEVERILFDHGIDPDSENFMTVPGMPGVAVIHSTSWRPDGSSVVLTYMAVIRAAGYVVETWPDAAPLTAALPAAVCKAPPHGAAEVPVPRWSTSPCTACGIWQFLATWRRRGDGGGAGRELAAAPGPAPARAGRDVQRAAGRVT